LTCAGCSRAQQKVDLAKISILALADQYLAFIESARQLRLELAADYLVMAAWLAYLKSRLAACRADSAGRPSAEEMANALAWQLRRLEAFREVSTQLMARPQLKRDVVRSRRPGAVADIKHPQWTATLYDLLSPMRRSASAARCRMCDLRRGRSGRWRRRVRRWSGLIGMAGDWSRLDEFLIAYLVEPSMRATVMASSLLRRSN